MFLLYRILKDVELGKLWLLEVVASRIIPCLRRFNMKIFRFYMVIDSIRIYLCIHKSVNYNIHGAMSEWYAISLNSFHLLKFHKKQPDGRDKKDGTRQKKTIGLHET